MLEQNGQDLPKICCCSATQSCPTLCDLMVCSIPGFPVLYHFMEFVETHVHWVGNAIQPFRPLLSPSPPAFSLSQDQDFFPMNRLFTSGGHSIGASASAPVLPMNIQSWFPLGLSGLIYLLSKGPFKSLLQHHSSKASILWCSTFFIVNSHIDIWLLEKP